MSSMDTVTRRQIGALAAAALVGLAGAATTVSQEPSSASPASFDHQYRRYADLLQAHVVGVRVDYRRLTDARGDLEAIVDDLGSVSERELHIWTDEQQLAYWINAYNVFTLDAITRHYPIRNRWFTIFGLVPPNSIKQIPGVWSRLRWRAGGAARTLDEIEHDIIRVRFEEPMIHFAVNCAAVSCPPLQRTPYLGSRLDTQLSRAARDFLDSPQGIVVDGSTLMVSRIFSWYGEDFVTGYADLISSDRPATERAILGVVSRYGPPAAVRLARSAAVEVEFLDYDWGLNDVGGDGAR